MPSQQPTEKPPQDLGPYRLKLREWATLLRVSSPGMPVLLQNVCRQVGVKLKWSDSVPEFKAYLSVDPSKEHPASILLPTTVSIGNFERLCIAHELAHYFLLSNYKLLPSSKSEYWLHEELCDDFARHLLIPDEYVVKQTADTPPSLPAYLNLCRKIASFSKTPWIHAAIRITEVNSNVAFLRCSIPTAKGEIASDIKKLSPSTDRNRHATQSNKFVVLASSYPRQQGIRTQIKQGTALYSRLQQMVEEANVRGNCVQREITEELKESLKKKIVPKQARAFAEIERSKYQDVKIAIGAAELGYHDGLE